jgi:hypothetical protein
LGVGRAEKGTEEGGGDGNEERGYRSSKNVKKKVTS